MSESESQGRSLENCREIAHSGESQINHLEIKRSLNFLPPTSSKQITQNITEYTGIIKKFLTQGSARKAISLYIQIRRSGLYCVRAIPLVFKACASLVDLNFGKALHPEAYKAGTVSSVLVGTSLLDMYAKCGDIISSRHVFDQMPERNVIAWNAMVGGYMRNGDVRSASSLFEKMLDKTEVTWAEMIGGYARNGDTKKARSLFDGVSNELRNVVIWTVMVDGYANKGEMEAAREVFEEMPERNCFAWSSMISGYCRKGEVEEAKIIFDRIPERNIANWNSLISGYAQNGYCKEALETFWHMQAEGIMADEITIASVLSACSQLGTLDVGKKIHDVINHKGFNLNPNQFVLNALVDMYAMCGDLANAESIFESMPERNVACWNAMISAFASHGESEKALHLFAKMENSNEKPDWITFLSVLSACSHGGFVKEGLEIFSKMDTCGVVAGVKHYGCVVDLLGRAGETKKAYDLVNSMSIEPNDGVWGALLGACKVHSDMETAEVVVKRIGEMGSGLLSGNDSHHVLLSNIFASANRWEKAETMRMEMACKGLQKVRGCSTIG